MIDPKFARKKRYWVTNIILFTALGVMALYSIRDALIMRGNLVITTAVVTETREEQDGFFKDYGLRYSFLVPGDPTTYTSRDRTGRQNLWNSFEKEDWERAKATGWIYVGYLPDDPWLNEPLDYERQPLQDNLANYVFALVLFAVMLFRVIMSSGLIPYNPGKPEVEPFDDGLDEDWD